MVHDSRAFLLMFLKHCYGHYQESYLKMGGAQRSSKLQIKNCVPIGPVGLLEATASGY